MNDGGPVSVSALVRKTEGGGESVYGTVHSKDREPSSLPSKRINYRQRVHETGLGLGSPSSQ
jgi:hypothetical protein